MPLVSFIILCKAHNFLTKSRFAGSAFETSDDGAERAVGHVGSWKVVDKGVRFVRTDGPRPRHAERPGMPAPRVIGRTATVRELERELGVR